MKKIYTLLMVMLVATCVVAQTQVYKGTQVKMTATPKTGYHFCQWNDGNLNATRTVTVNSNVNYVATFASNSSQHTITTAVNNANFGTVLGGGSYDYNSTISLISRAMKGYHFVKWQDGDTNVTRSIKVLRDAKYTATFAPDTFKVVAKVNDAKMGSTRVVGSKAYKETTKLYVDTVVGYSFFQWNDGNKTNPRSVVVMQDTTLMALLQPTKYAITAVPNNAAYGDVTGGGQHAYNNVITLTATPKLGCLFIQWSDGNANPTRQITVKGNAKYTAQFAVDPTVTINTITVTSANETMGTVEGGNTYVEGTVATLKAIANYGYHFTQWSDGNKDNPRTVLVSGNKTYTAQFAKNNYKVTTEVNADEMGVVDGSGSYAYLSSVSLAATANTGYYFEKWSDGVTTNPRSVKVEKDVTYTAQFKPFTYCLTVAANDGAYGMVYGTDCYDYNTDAQITAESKAGYEFVKWADGNTDNPRLVRVTNNATYTAVFDVKKYSLSVATNDSDAGSVSGAGRFPLNANASILAVANYGYEFVNWNDGFTENPRTILISQDTSFVANFQTKSYKLTVSTANASQGTVTGGGTYAYQTMVTITAIPKIGCKFEKWSDGNTDNPRQIVVSKSDSCTAQFSAIKYNVIVKSEDANKGTADAAGQYTSYEYGTNVSISAIANTGYKFNMWSDGNTDNPRIITVVADVEYTALFSISQYTLNLSSDSSDKGVVAALGGDTFDYGSTVTITATPKYGYEFERWSDGNTTNPRTIVVSDNNNYSAIFKTKQYNITATSAFSAQGSVSGSGMYDYNTYANVLATAKEGYSFEKWSDGNTDNPRVILVTKDETIYAQFSAQKYTVGVSVNDVVMGQVIGAGDYAYGSSINIQAVASNGYEFVSWNDENTQNPRAINVTGNVYYIALFQPKKIIITTMPNFVTMGSVTGGGSYTNNSQVVLQAVPNNGYEFVSWNDGNTQNTRIVTVTKEETYIAQFKEIDYSVSVVSIDESKGTIVGGGEYSYGSEITIFAQPKLGYEFVSWNDGVTENPRTVVVTGNMLYTATFVKQNLGIEDPNNPGDSENPSDPGTSVSDEGLIVLVYGGESRVIVENAEGQLLTLYSLKGQILEVRKLVSNKELFEVGNPGVYIVNVGESTYKVIVK